MISQKFAVLVPKKGAIGAFSQFRIVNFLNDSVKILDCHHSFITVSWPTIETFVTL